MSFDWKTDEPDWDETDSPAEEPRRRERVLASPRPVRLPRQARLPWRDRRGLVFAGLALLLLAGLAAVLYRQLDRRADAAVERIRSDVLASQQIITQAAREQDRELFVGFLSGRDDDWAASEESLVDAGGYLGRTSFAWTWQPEAVLPAAVTVSNDLLSADLEVPHRYVIEAGGGLTETITLTQTAVFRPATDRWLLSPPDEEYWGEMATAEGRYLRLSYPERDAGLAGELAPALDATLVRLCTQVEDLECPEDLRVNLTLSTDPMTLAPRPAEWQQAGLDLVMPTPTLLGRPADVASERALFRAYAVQVVRNVVTASLGLAVAPPDLYYGVLLAALLRELDLAPWPAASSDFARLAREPEAAEALQAYWQAGTQPPPAAVWPAYVLVDYLTQELGSPVIPMMADLSGPVPLGFSDWLDRASGGRFTTAAGFERELVRFAYAESAASGPPFPLPAQALQLACSSGQDVPPVMVRHDVGAGTTERVKTLGKATRPMLVALPDDTGVVIAERGEPFASRPPTLWRDGMESELTFSAVSTGAPVVPVGENTAGGEMLFLLDVANSTPIYGLLQPRTCAGPACDLHPVLGDVVWSPDGMRTLLSVAGASPLAADRRVPLLFLADGLGNGGRTLERGLSPFWVDARTFGYVSEYTSGDGQRVFVRQVDTPAASAGLAPAVTSSQPELGAAPAGDVVLTSADLQDVAATSMASGPYIDRFLPVPGDPSRFFVATAEPLISGSAGGVLLFDLETGEASRRFEMKDEPALFQRSYKFSPDGRFLLIVSLRDEDRADGTRVWNAYLHDVEANTTRTFTLEADPAWPGQYLADWSADGHWLSLLTNGYVRLVALGVDYEQPVILPELACTAAVWVDQRSVPGG